MERWIADLQQPDERRQVAAAEALAALGAEAQPAIVALVQMCGSKAESVRNWCTAALEDVGPPAQAQFDDLMLLAKSANNDVAYWAITLLGRAGKQAAEAVPVLQERMADDSSPQVQQRAAWALGQVEQG